MELNTFNLFISDITGSTLFFLVDDILNQDFINKDIRKT